MQRLETQCRSSDTLARGMELASRPLADILNIKAEPEDEEEQQMQDEMQVGEVLKTL